jgi:hypothetical protein
MRAEYDFSKGKRGALIPQKGKTRISIYIDNATLQAFRERAEASGSGYQTMMNDALRAYLVEAEPPLTESRLREVLEETLPQVKRLTRRPSGRAAKAASRRSP